MRVKKPTPEAHERRLKLRVAIKVLMYVAVAAVLYVFFAAIRTGSGKVPEVPSKKVDVGDMEPGQTRFLTWEGRPVVIYRRQSADFAQLRTPDDRLEDENSSSSTQPTTAENAYRSVEPDWFVAIALGTDLGCSLEFLPPTTEPFQQRPWVGGFVDTCRKSRYDLAGRVYESQYATKNLVVPSYAVKQNILILGR